MMTTYGLALFRRFAKYDSEEPEKKISLSGDTRQLRFAREISHRACGTSTPIPYFQDSCQQQRTASQRVEHTKQHVPHAQKTPPSLPPLNTTHHVAGGCNAPRRIRRPAPSCVGHHLCHQQFATHATTLLRPVIFSSRSSSSSTRSPTVRATEHEDDSDEDARGLGSASG